MDSIAAALRERYDRVLIENEMLRAGFAALPYLVLKDTRLSVGARAGYAILLMYAWQEGSCFPGQNRMAGDLGVSTRQLRRYLQELKTYGYVSWHRIAPWGNNAYFLHDVHSKLKAKPKQTSVSRPGGRRRPIGGDTPVRIIDAAHRPKEIDSAPKI